MTTLEKLAEDVLPPDLEAADAFLGRAAEAGRGTLRDIATWLAGVQGRTEPHPPGRVRVVRFGFAEDAAPPRAGDGDVRNVPTQHVGPADAAALGVHIADDEIDRGADLVILVVARSGVCAEIVTAVLTDAEPVKVLPRGNALPPEEWMSRAEQVRDGRRRAVAARRSVDALLDTVGDPSLIAATAFVLRTAARRTGLIADGFAALAATLAAYEQQSRIGRWCRIADSAGSPGEGLALGRLGQRALLELGVETDDGTGGLLASVVVRFAVESATTGAA